jgi:hypothetical protein
MGIVDWSMNPQDSPVEGEPAILQRNKAISERATPLAGL